MVHARRNGRHEHGLRTKSYKDSACGNVTRGLVRRLAVGFHRLPTLSQRQSCPHLAGASSGTGTAMDKFTCMQALVRVVESGSFAEAARRMGVSAPMVTKYIGHLEQSLGTRLLNRSTHSLSLTDSGQAYYQRCVQLLEDLDEAESIAGAQSTAPRGFLRMSVSSDFGVNHLGPVLLEYSRQYPDVRMEVSVSNHLVDLIEEGFDL